MTYSTRAPRPRERARDLQQQRRLAGAGRSADEYEAAGNDAAAEQRIELLITGRDARDGRASSTSPSRVGRACGGERPARACAAGPPCRATGASANVFHASQAGQRPSQRADSCPHAEQKKARSLRATGRSFDGEVARTTSPVTGSPRRREKPGGRVNKHPHVAIDGPAASGKTTVARAVATRLGALYLDTGAMYRAVALLVLRAGADPGGRSGGDAAAGGAARSIVEPDRAAPLGYRVLVGGVEAGRRAFGQRRRRGRLDSRRAPARARRAGAGAARDRRPRAGRDGGPRHRDRRAAGRAGEDLPDGLARGARRAPRRRTGGARDAGRSRRLSRAARRTRPRSTAASAVAPLRPAPGATIIDSSDLSAAQVVDRIVAARPRAAAG